MDSAKISTVPLQLASSEAEAVERSGEEAEDKKMPHCFLNHHPSASQSERPALNRMTDANT